MDPDAARWRIEGRGVSPGAACGPLRLTSTGRARQHDLGAVLLLDRLRPSDADRISVCAATITRGVAPLSHAALLSRELGKPSVALTGGVGPPGEVERGLIALLEGRREAGEAAPCEGDVVMVDGDQGSVTLFGGTDPSQRARVRRALRALRVACSAETEELARAPLTARLGGRGAPLRFLLEVLLWSDPAVCSDPAARRIVEAVRADPERRRELAALARPLAARIVERGRRWRRQLLRELEGPVDARRHRTASAELARRRARERFSLGLLEFVPAEAADADGRLASRLDRCRSELTASCTARLSHARGLDDASLVERHRELRAWLDDARTLGVSPERTAELAARLEAAISRRLGRARLVLPLDPAVPAERRLVGGKAAGLLRAASRTLPPRAGVPPGFVVTTAAYRLHVLGELRARLGRALDGSGDLAAISREARAAVLGAAVPPEVAGAIARAVSGLASERLAIRSSATLEDHGAPPLTGAMDTVLGALPEGAVREVRRVWASLWDVRVLALLRRAGTRPLDVECAVLLQPMIAAEVSGVLRTRDPAAADELQISAAWGLGEPLAAGEIEGQHYRLSRGDGRITERRLADETTRVVLEGGGRGGTVTETLPTALRRAPCLDEERLGRLADLADALESELRGPLVAEFAFDRPGTLWLLQVRPLRERVQV